jgi:CheY-like chemotaxis protein
MRVDMVSSGEEALEKVNSCIYDMILMDIQMPGMDGFETTKMIRSKEGDYFKEVPIIAMTASTSESTRRRIFAAGMQDLVRKPISADDLRSRMIQHIKLDSQILEGPEDGWIWDESEEASAGARVNFEQTDKLFSENVVRYQEFLRMSIEELSVNRDILLAAIIGEDFEVFRKVNHRMKNLLGTLSVNDLLDHLEEIKERLAKNQLSENTREEIAAELKISIEDIIDIMSNKQASLKWQ